LRSVIFPPYDLYLNFDLLQQEFAVINEFFVLIGCGGGNHFGVNRTDEQPYYQPRLDIATSVSSFS
jgi:hypothetical protein